jgi:hypothetical protein
MNPTELARAMSTGLAKRAFRPDTRVTWRIGFALGDPSRVGTVFLGTRRETVVMWDDEPNKPAYVATIALVAVK